MAMKEPIVIRPELADQFFAAMENGRVVLFTAPCGFGKSVTAQVLLAGWQVCVLSADAPDFALPTGAENWDVLLLDQLQALQEPADQQALCTLIRENPSKRFVLLSRGTAPGWLISFQFAGLVQIFNAQSLLLDRERVGELLAAYGVQVSELELKTLLRESMGYPLALVLAVRHLQDGAQYDAQMDAAIRRELFAYYEEAVYHRLSLELRVFLLELAPFEVFDVELARIASGNPRAGELLGWLQSNTSMLQYDGVAKYHFWFIFREYLMWELDRTYTAEQCKKIYNRGGLYYELQEDYSNALACYKMSGDHQRISELLIKNAQLHPGMGHYYEMAQYYHALPEQEILASPVLMQSMSILCALEMDYDASERWYRELETFAARRKRSDEACKEARSRLAWLGISLPQRGVDSLVETFLRLAKLLASREIALPPLSVTSALPSLLNGGKDFSAWTKKDDALYRTLRLPVEAAVGRDSVGLADCAIAESKFEQGADITARMLALMARLNEIQRTGTPDIEFATLGLLARSQVAAGQAGNAKSTLESLRLRFIELGQTRFLPNLDAMLCRIALYLGELETATQWYRASAPRDPVHLYVMKRYQYLTQAMVEINLGQPTDALLTLAPLENYFRRCERHLDLLQLLLLRAIAYAARREPDWRAALQEALDIAATYHYIRPVSSFGAAILPLLEKCDWVKDAAFLQAVLGAARIQAAYYPDYLQTRDAPAAALTATEQQVLRLLCADRSNAEIGQILDIKLATVKTHVSHILQKLGVKRRSEAKTVAQQRGLSPGNGI